MTTLDAHFDRKVVVLDEPAGLEPNTKVKVLVVDESDSGFASEFTRLSEAAFQRIWDNSLDADYDRRKEPGR